MRRILTIYLVAMIIRAFKQSFNYNSRFIIQPYASSPLTVSTNAKIKIILLCTFAPI